VCRVFGVTARELRREWHEVSVDPGRGIWMGCMGDEVLGRLPSCRPAQPSIGPGAWGAGRGNTPTQRSHRSMRKWDVIPLRSRGSVIVGNGEHWGVPGEFMAWDMEKQIGAVTGPRPVLRGVVRESQNGKCYLHNRRGCQGWRDAGMQGWPADEFGGVADAQGHT
jgi:hypothetical protein